MGEGEGKERDREGKKEGLFLLRRTDVPKGGEKGEGSLENGKRKGEGGREAIQFASNLVRKGGREGEMVFSAPFASISEEKKLRKRKEGNRASDIEEADRKLKKVEGGGGSLDFFCLHLPPFPLLFFPRPK